MQDPQPVLRASKYSNAIAYGSYEPSQTVRALQLYRPVVRVSNIWPNPAASARHEQNWLLESLTARLAYGKRQHVQLRYKACTHLGSVVRGHVTCRLGYAHLHVQPRNGIRSESSAEGRWGHTLCMPTGRCASAPAVRSTTTHRGYRQAACRSCEGLHAPRRNAAGRQCGVRSRHRRLMPRAAEGRLGPGTACLRRQSLPSAHPSRQIIVPASYPHTKRRWYGLHRSRLCTPRPSSSRVRGVCGAQ